jgi:hypothetical protein
MPHVEFADEMKLEVVGAFGSPQPNVPNSAEIPSWDIRWKVFVEKNSPPLGMPPISPEPTERWEDASTKTMENNV